MAERPGVHQRGTYVALVHGLHQACRTGILEVRSGRAWRRLYFVSGNAVWYASDKVEEELARTLVKDGLVPAQKMKALSSSRTPFEPLSDRLLSEGLVSAELLREHRLQQLGPAVSAPLAWEGGEWSFEGRDALPLDAIDNSLFPDCQVLSELWAGVPQFVQMQEALSEVAGEAGRRLVPRSRLAESIDSIGLTGPLAELADALGAGASIEELFQSIPDRSGHLMQLLWFLWNCDAIGDPDQPADQVTTLLAGGQDHLQAAKMQQDRRRSKETRATAKAPRKPAARPATKKGGVASAKATASKKVSSPAKKPAKSVAPARDEAKAQHLSRLIRTAHEHRMGKDFYEFFDLSNTASAEDVRSAYDRLSRGWSAAAEDSNLMEEDYGRVKELLHAAKLVWQTLADGNRRKEYDQRLAAGTAPRLDSQLEMLMAMERAKGTQEDLKSRSARLPSAPGGARHSEARDFMRRGDYEAALPPLREARSSSGSEASVLADLGWCTWKVHRGQIPDGQQESAEDLLLLAQTFDPSHGKTMEYLCRMAREKGDSARTVLWLQRLLKAHPRSRWALEMQGKLRSEGLMPEGGKSRRGK